jgi:GMP synthase-like glutamine amidotransferase
MRIAVILHCDFEGPAYIKDWAEENHHSLEEIHIYKDGVLPSDNYDGYIFMGGNMSSNDHSEFFWLIDEKQFISNLIKANKKVLGICLGAQLIANAVGCRVVPMPQKEIGWFDVYLNENRDIIPEFDIIETLHWHGEEILPNDRIEIIGKSQQCDVQIFKVNDNCYGFQCHLEQTMDSLIDMYANCFDDIDDSPNTQQYDALFDPEDLFAANNKLFSKFLDQFFAY